MEIKKERSAQREKCRSFETSRKKTPNMAADLVQGLRGGGIVGVATTTERMELNGQAIFSGSSEEKKMVSHAWEIDRKEEGTETCSSGRWTAV